MKCDKCGKTFEEGNYPDGTPNGMGFVMQNGNVLTLCHDCIASISEKEGRQWLEEWKNDNA